PLPAVPSDVTDPAGWKKFAEKIQSDLRKANQQRAAQLEARMKSVEKRAEAQKAAQDRLTALFGSDLEVPVRNGDTIVGHLSARLRSDEIFRRVWESTPTRNGAIPFAIDGDGTLYTASPEAKATLTSLPLPTTSVSGTTSRTILDNWVIAMTKDASSGLTFGLARPLDKPLNEVRLTAIRNFSYGLGLIFIALLGIIPIASHITRDVGAVTHGAQRIAAGDLDVEVPVRGKGEFGQLALAFNQMARDLREHQERLVEEERLRKEQEIRERLLTAEFDRKTEELEEARRFQLSLLPKSLPEHPLFEIAVYMKTATEVGGDYYDFHKSDDGALTIAVGDATGHGARAGTMVTVIKSLFSSLPPEKRLSTFLTEANHTIRRMDLGRMAMALSLVRLEGNRMTLATAGMPPALVLRSTGEVTELSIDASPLGTFAKDYEEVEVTLAPDDIVLLMSDGFPELLNPAGDPLGYVAAQNAFRETLSADPAQVIEQLVAAADRWKKDAVLNDDMTFVVVRARTR
ncbi:MAG: SpoIIE family protein phosphatase, partial [Thermoanaerobaculia bacterium]